MTVTDRDIRDQVLAALDCYASQHDVEGMVRELIERFDLTGEHPRDTLGGIPTEDFWAIAERHQV
jgi:hypothetical protein